MSCKLLDAILDFGVDLVKRVRRGCGLVSGEQGLWRAGWGRGDVGWWCALGLVRVVGVVVVGLVGWGCFGWVARLLFSGDC